MTALFRRGARSRARGGAKFFEMPLMFKRLRRRVIKTEAFAIFAFMALLHHSIALIPVITDGSEGLFPVFSKSRIILF